MSAPEPVLTSLAVAGALMAALAYGAGSVLQAVGVRRTTGAAAGSQSLLRLGRQPPYLAGLLLDGVGFALSLFALHRLPLFLVQAAVAASVGVTAVLASRYLAVELRRLDWVALAALGAGLLLLAISAQAQASRPLSATGGWLVLGGVVVTLVLGGVASRLDDVSGAALAAAAGAAFGGVGVAARALVLPHPIWALASDPLPYAVAGYGVLGTIFFATALQRTPVTVATAILFAVETLVPAGIGVGLLGDTARPGFIPAAAAGFLLTLGGALALARHAHHSPRVP